MLELQRYRLHCGDQQDVWGIVIEYFNNNKIPLRCFGAFRNQVRGGFPLTCRVSHNSSYNTRYIQNGPTMSCRYGYRLTR